MTSVITTLYILARNVMLTSGYVCLISMHLVTIQKQLFLYIYQQINSLYFDTFGVSNIVETLLKYD